MIEVVNDGPLVVSSTYWGSEYERSGKLFFSTHAGAVRVLLPSSATPVLKDLRAAEYAILSRGPWPGVAPEGVEILWEGRSDSLPAWRVTAANFDRLPGEPPPGKQWVISVWDLREGRPHQALERPCYWRRVPRLPWLQPWGGPVPEGVRA
jgi:hypothetical protein